MDIETWKKALVSEIEIAAEWRAERVFAEPDDPRIETSQKALFDLADKVRAMSSSHPNLKALFNEETELFTLVRATPGEPENRYHESKEDLLRTYGVEREPMKDADEFLKVLRTRVDETITEYRLR